MIACGDDHESSVNVRFAVLPSSTARLLAATDVVVDDDVTDEGPAAKNEE